MTATREEALQGAAEVLVDAVIRIETEKAIASATTDAQEPERAA